MPRQYIFHDSETAVLGMLRGMKSAHPGLYVDPENKIVMLNRNRKNRVGLISGAGAGYEPFGPGLVGEGMLTAYVYGEMFQSPLVKTISKVIHNVAMLNGGGVLCLLLNYPRQVYNFGLAIERARLKGIHVESFVITDDCTRTGDAELVALETNLSLRMGLSGAAYVFKILGTMSSLGYSLVDILDTAMSLNFRLATIGFSMTPCAPFGENTIPPGKEIPEGEVAIGAYLPDEQAVRITKADSTKSIIAEILPKAVEQCGLKDISHPKCCVLVNNLGSMTEMELYAIANEVDLFMGGRDICIERLYVGSVLTALTTKGGLISLLNVTDSPEWLSYLDSCTEAFAWPGCRLSKKNEKLTRKEYKEEHLAARVSYIQGMVLSYPEEMIFQNCLIAACDAVIENEDIINKLNSITGNGDCGTNMMKFAVAVKENVKDIPLDDVSKVFAFLSAIADDKMSGSIGSLYSIALEGAATNADCWVNCWENAISNIKKITDAKIGNRTLIDVLLPAFEMFVERILTLGDSRWKEALEEAVQCAECWCFKTASMKPNAGRAMFASKYQTNNMDAGAYGVYVWLKAVYDTLIRETLFHDDSGTSSK